MYRVREKKAEEEREKEKVKERERRELGKQLQQLKEAQVFCLMNPVLNVAKDYPFGESYV